MDKINKTKLLIILCAIFLCGYILNLGSYPLLDLDETRYVNMAREMFISKEFTTLYLNGEYFFEKPPLYFWIECLSFKFFNINEFTARLPVVLLSLLPLSLLFNLCNKIKGFKFAFITGAVLLTFLEYVLITKISILDGVLTSFCASSVICYFYTFYTQNKAPFWVLSYIFMGLAVLAKGIPGVAVPVLVIIVSTIVFKTYKETFKYLLLGVPIFLLITLPWHILMLKEHSYVFFYEYIYKHHILRFLGSDVIHRSEPFYFYLLTLLWGLVPNVLMLLGVNKIKWDKFIKLNLIAVFSIIVFFSLSGAKLITYILPVYPFLAVIIAQIWTYYIENDDKILKNSVIVMNSVLIIGAVGFPFVAVYVFKQGGAALYLSQIILTVFSVFLIKALIKNEKFKIFVLQSLFFSLIVGLYTPFGYKIDYSFGQDDLMKFAKIAKENNYTISTYLTGQKYSLLYYSGLRKIEFKTKNDIKWLDKELNKKNHIVIIRNKKIKDLPVKIKEKGVKFSIIERI